MSQASADTEDKPYARMPCVSLCSIDDQTGFCRGCLRTYEEISGWWRCTNDERLAILAELEKRREAMQNPQA